MNPTIEETHADMVAALIKEGHHIMNEMSPRKAALIHDAFGIAGEAGELLDAIKKHTIYNQELNRTNVIEELGDLEFFMQDLRESLNLTRSEVLSANIAKLTKRYPSMSFSNEAAEKRADKS